MLSGLSGGSIVRGMTAPFDDDQRAALLALLRTAPSGRRWDEIAERVALTLDAVGLWRELVSDTLFSTSADDAALVQARNDILRWSDGPFRMLTFLDAEYPDRLRSVRQVPPLLFVQGRLIPPHERGVSVVGSRKASQSGLDFAAEVCRRLVRANLSVISGLALGVDTTAHRAALETGGRTVAIVGCGLGQVYPPSNAELQAQIAREGLVISQFMPEFSPTRWSFPLRNATMSAYGYATIIVEASERSGTRIQAREAVGHGRPVIVRDSVVTSTAWGRELVDQPGVYVAHTPQDAVEIVEQVIDSDAEVARLLSMA